MYLSEIKSQIIMQNIPCIFRTKNTNNEFGNSTYWISNSTVFRHAPTNKLKDKSWIMYEAEHMTYISLKQRKVIKFNGSFKNTLLKVISYDDESIKVAVENKITLEKNILILSKKPSYGTDVFDFKVDEYNKIFNRHVGHKVLYFISVDSSRLNLKNKIIHTIRNIFFDK